MTIAEELQRIITAKSDFKKLMTDRMAINVGSELISQYPAMINASQLVWVRPSDWLEIDSLVTAGEQKTVGLYAVYPTNNTLGMTNTVAFTVTGNHTIDWGDGSALENVASNVQAQHIYDYSTISSATECSRGYRQVRITITPQSGQNITNIQFGKKHTSVIFGRIMSQWLDINISGTALTTFRFSEISYANLLEKVKVYQSTNACTNMSNMFQYCYSLQSPNLSNFNTAAVTNMSSMFQYCYSLQSLNLSQTTLSAVNSAGSFANFSIGTISLASVRIPNTKWSFTVANNPLSASALNTLFGDLFDLTSQTAQTITITGCTGASTCDKTIATAKNWVVVG